MIQIKQTKEFPNAEFEVGVEGSVYTVGLTEDYYKKLTREEVVPEDLIRRSFEFLLAREQKESILKKFDLPEIYNYFPEFEVEVYTKNDLV